ncbi:MAG TPA: hypothetical protein VGX70_00755 [Gemmataceae bacterium]|jgi:hypothetical protein|nr:hypothetical protein [Gemmataceae bacterium]
MLPELARDDAQKRRNRFYLQLEVFLLAATVAGCAGLTVLHVFWLAVIVIVLLAWQLIAFPACFLYLIGKPLVTSESPKFRRRMRKQPALSDDEFYDQYYRGSDVPKDTVVRLRRCLIEEFDPMVERALPSDCLALLNDEIDFADVLWRVGQHLNIRFVRADYQNIDGSFDNLVRETHRRLSKYPRWTNF